ncbi:hypothetical protein GCM10010222_47660 [Streptomyces tanashiensis]|nr:hypothetical protein GCM10010222_47660 [Streptomyces tanashiensis]
METMPPTLIESAVTPRTEEGAVPPLEAELQAVTSSRAKVAAMTRNGRGTGDPSVGDRIL